MNNNGHIPRKWTSTTLGEIGEWCGGGTPSKENSSYWADGTMPWVSPKDMKCLRIQDSEDHISQLATQETNVKPFSPGTVLIVVRSGILARTLPVAVCDVPATMNQDLKGIKPFDGIDPLYIAYFMIGSERGILHQCCKSGTTVASIEIPRLKAFPIRLPPTNEQRRIVEKIDELFSELDAGVAALKRIKANLKRYRAAVLKAAVVGRLTEEWRAKHPRTEPASKLLERILAERRKKWGEDQLAKFAADDKEPPKKWREKYVEPAAPDTSELRELPKGWTWATVEQVTHFAKYGSSAKTSTDDAGVPVLRMGNIQDGSLDLTDLKYLPKDHDEFPDLLLQEGDLLFNRTNSAELVGKSAIYHGNPTPCSYASYLIGLRTVCGCTPELLCYYLNSWCGRAWIASVVSQQVGQANVNGSKLQALVFPLPPVPEQTQIIAEVERCFSNIAVAQAQVDTNLKRADRLCQSILKRAFEGNLVPQDPTDEPADKLLERIRQERTATNGNGVAPRTRRGRVAKQNTPKAKRTESHHE